MVVRREQARAAAGDNAREVIERLRRVLPAEVVRGDATTRAAYVSDGSVFRIPPSAVVLPRDADDVARVLEVARESRTPVTARGGGTSIAGNAIGEGIVLDFSRHMDRIVSIDPGTRTAVVQPGVVLDDLRAAAAAHGLTFGPDPSTHSRCTIGGMIGNNACGPHSVRWGTTADNVIGLRGLLADGRAIDAGRGSSGDPDIDDRLRRLRDRHLVPLRTELGRFSRQVSGYGLHHLLPENGFDVAKALVGSESTCAVVTEATVRLVPSPPVRLLVVFGFPDVFEAATAAADVARCDVLTVEGMARDLIDALRTRPGREQAGGELPPGDGWLYCEVGGADTEQAMAAARAVTALVAERFPAASARVVTDPAQARALWAIREAGAGIAARMADGGEAWAGWEDSAVPVGALADYLRDLYRLMDSHGLRGIPYGHFGEGCLHLRCDYDLHTEHGLAAYRAFMADAADLVAAHGGSVSGEHGDGRARSELLPRMYGPQTLTAFAAFKEVFDPERLLNPGVLVDPAPLDAEVRPGPGHDRLDLLPVHALSGDGGSFARAVGRCVGVGSCRTLHAGSMCPSFKATRDEVHSTRGRARVLAEMLRGQTLPRGWRSTEVRDALDLCLSCKACATACPVNVDMATYKAEFLHRHYAWRPRPLAHLSMGWLPVWSRLVTAAAPVARAVNALTARPAVAALVKRIAGIEPRREMIGFAAPTLRRWMGRRPSSQKIYNVKAVARDTTSQSPRTVVLWPDTFTNFHDPGPGRAAVEVLETLGYRVELPRGPVCCGLTWHSTGQLGPARRALRGALRALEEALAADRPVLVLEPSCAVMLREEARELLPDDPRAHRLARLVTTLAELVDAHDGPWPFGDLDVDAVTQIHCHQEAKGSFDADLRVLGRLRVRSDRIGSGCCGLAGNFGFERGHWEVSQACAERELYPKVRAAAREDLVLADGFSCRTQIAQGTDRRARHLAEVLHAALRAGGDRGPGAPSGGAREET
ncbi:FAD-binding and (Fe-S)-binding domain-containing protein [Marinactinospora endophytica]